MCFESSMINYRHHEHRYIILDWKLTKKSATFLKCLTLDLQGQNCSTKKTEAEGQVISLTCSVGGKVVYRNRLYYITLLKLWHTPSRCYDVQPDHWIRTKIITRGCDVSMMGLKINHTNRQSKKLFKRYDIQNAVKGNINC